MSETLTSQSSNTFWNRFAPLRVLLIENSADDADLNLRQLERAGFRCQPVRIGGRAQFQKQLERFPFDIVLADYRLHGWTGMEAFAEMRRAGREIPFVLVAGAVDEEVAFECFKQGVTDYVLKDHLERLPLVVTRALEEKALRDARSLMVQALRQSEANSLFLFDHNPLPMWVLERETLQFLQVNDATLRNYGYERLQFLAMNAGDLLPPDEISIFRAAVQEPIPRPQPAGDWHVRKHDGSTIDVEMYMHPIEYLRKPAAVVVALDVTERRRAEEEKQKFFTLVENSRDFVGVADFRGNPEYINPAGRALLGISELDSIKQTSWSEFLVPGDLPFVQTTVIPALEASGYWKGELHFRHRESHRPVLMDVVGFQVRDEKTGGPRFFATVSRDIGERRALELQLRSAQKFEAFGQLAGGIAHDFNNVIGAILGWAELGEEQAASSDPALLNCFRKIHQQCDRVTSLVRQLLAFARRQILEPRSMNVNQTVRDVLNLLDKVIGKDIEIGTVLAEDLAAVRADPTQVEQVLVNLCINARDAMPNGGRLTIETQNAAFDEEDCRRTLGLQPGHFVELRVSDTGIGMDAETRDRIFEPFFTTKGPGKGTGLGLATVYGIVKQHGGFIQVESELGKGSAFRVFLPSSEAETRGGERSAGVDESPVRGGNETILLADDNDGIREMAQSVLSAKGYEVLVARDGEEAVEVFSLHRDRISLVVLDVVMPRRNGPDVFAGVQALKPGISVVFATGYSNEMAVLADLAAQGISVLMKPYSPSTLCRRVREALDAIGKNRLASGND